MPMTGTHNDFREQLDLSLATYLKNNRDPEFTPSILKFQIRSIYDAEFSLVVANVISFGELIHAVTVVASSDGGCKYAGGKLGSAFFLVNLIMHWIKLGKPIEEYIKWFDHLSLASSIIATFDVVSAVKEMDDMQMSFPPQQSHIDLLEMIQI